MQPLSADRASQLPWAFYSRARGDPPTRCDSGRRGQLRGCHLCGAPYIGGDENLGCVGAESCPRHYGYRRRHLEWFGGHWVPRVLSRLWAAEDAAAVASSAPTVDAQAVARPPPEPVAAKPPHPVLPGQAGPRGRPAVPEFKAPPTAAQFANFDALHPRPGASPAFKAAPACFLQRPAFGGGAGGGCRPPARITPPYGNSGRSRSPNSAAVAKPPPLLPGPAGLRCLPVLPSFKSPPTAAQMAQYDALHLRIDPLPAFKPPPVSRPSPVAVVRGGTRPPLEVAPLDSQRSRSPDGGARLFAAAVAGVYVPIGDDSSDEVLEWVPEVPAAGGGEGGADPEGRDAAAEHKEKGGEGDAEDL